METEKAYNEMSAV